MELRSVQSNKKLLLFVTAVFVFWEDPAVIKFLRESLVSKIGMRYVITYPYTSDGQFNGRSSQISVP